MKLSSAFSEFFTGYLVLSVALPVLIFAEPAPAHAEQQTTITMSDFDLPWNAFDTKSNNPTEKALSVFMERQGFLTFGYRCGLYGKIPEEHMNWYQDHVLSEGATMLQRMGPEYTTQAYTIVGNYMDQHATLLERCEALEPFVWDMVHKLWK